MRNPFKGILKRASVSDPHFWPLRFFTGAASGANVTVDNALRVSAVLACNRVLSETIASLPLMLYRRRSDGGKEPATDHPLYSVMHDAPNDYMTSFDYRESLVTHLNFRGNHYARKIESRGYIEQLIPLNPAKMEIQVKSGRPLYTYTYEDGDQAKFQPEEIWHMKNLPISSTHSGSAPEGILGVPTIEMAREVIGLAMAADEYGARYFGNNASFGLALRHPGKLSENAEALLKASLAEYAKLENKFKSLVLQEDMSIEKLGNTNKDSQFLEARQFEIEEIARIFRVPPVLIGHPTNTMTYASAEQLFLSFATYTIRPWCVRLEQSMNRYLLPEKDRGTYFFEHVMAGLLRGDLTSRYAAYAVGRQWGWLSVNDIRNLENENPVENGDIYLQPMNMVEAGTPPPGPEPAEPEDDPEEEPEADEE